MTSAEHGFAQEEVLGYPASVGLTDWHNLTELMQVLVAAILMSKVDGRRVGVYIGKGISY